MPGNDQSFDVDAYLRYIFGEENESERVGEQELHRPAQAPWPIGSDIGVTGLGGTIDKLQRRCGGQVANQCAKDPELLGGMIDDPPEEHAPQGMGRGPLRFSQDKGSLRLHHCPRRPLSDRGFRQTLEVRTLGCA